MNAAIAETIIRIDKSDYRFEEFALAICSLEHGVEFLPTSKTWDRGRDGRTTGSASSGFANLLCATLNKELDGKVEADLLRLTATSSPRHLIYCCSQPLSEHGIDDIDKAIRRHVPTGSVTVYGSEQLGHLAAKHSEVFEKHYHAEVQSVRSSLIERPKDEERLGLRLALITIGAEDGAGLRKAILQRTILEMLHSGKAQSTTMIAENLSKDLGLPRPLPVSLVDGVLKHEWREKTVNFADGKWTLTAYGEKFLAVAPVEATDHLLRGRQAIREKLEALIGFSFPEAQYEQVWAALLDFLSTLFYQNGLAVIQAIDAFLSGNEPVEVPDLKHLLADGARRCAGLCSSTAETSSRLQNAIIDTLTERTGPAFEWLTRTCERFVTLCCLGLEAKSSEEIRGALIAHDVVLDSDIILNYLCEGEADHKVTVDLLVRWLKAEGRILLAPVVLEEVAYHAWISGTDFAQTQHMFGKLAPYELRRFIRNAFVRAFHRISKNLSQWDLYIGQFKGNSPTDFGKVRNRLKSSLHAEILPDNYDEALAKRITGYSLKEAAREKIIDVDELEEDARHKIGRDGRLLASIFAARQSSAEIQGAHQIVLLSSSHILQKAERKFSAQLGKEPIVFQKGGFAYLLSMISDIHVGADTLRRALFEFGKGAKLTDTERRALRIIRSSGAYDLPWADRQLLQSQITSSIHREAAKLGVSDQQVRVLVMNGSAPETSAKVIADALRNLATGTVDEDRILEAERRIRLLETELAEARAALKKAAGKVTPS